MNFKRYHESKNLYNRQYMFAYIDSTGKIIENAANVLAYTEVEPNTTYTVSADLMATNGNRIAVFNTAPTANLTGSNVISISQRAYLFTITTNNDTKYIAWHTSFSDANRFSQFLQTSMLNTGSTPLPYEPYGNTWQTKSPMKYGTSTDTITTLPAVIYPTGTTATVGLKGQMEQSSIPSPTSPVMPQGTGNKTANLFSSVWEQGGINAIDGQNIVAGTIVRTKDYIPIKPNTAYSFSRDISNGYMNVRLYRADKSYIGSGSDSTIRLITGSTVPNPMGTNVSFCCFEVIDGEAAYIRLNDASNNTATKWLMVEGEYTRETMPEYEPHGYEIPISSASTTTPVYLGEVQTTRRVKKLMLTGEESWINVGGNAPYRLTINDIAISSSTASIEWYCSHYQSLSTNDSWASYDYCISRTSTTAQSLQFRDVTKGNITAFKQYLAQQYANGNPVCVWYVLATPETAVVNEPLRKIGNYADEVSGITIPTIAGANMLSVDTTLKPSEVTVNYKGWHPVTDVHERENGQWN